MTKAKTARKPKTADAAPVDVERILRESDERVAGMNRDSIRALLACIRQCAESVAGHLDDCKINEAVTNRSLGLEYRNWKPDNATEFEKSATDCLRQIEQVERTLSNPSATESAVLGAALTLISIGKWWGEFPNVFTAKDSASARNFRHRKPNGAETKRIAKQELAATLRGIRDEKLTDDERNAKQEVIAESVATIYERQTGETIKPRRVQDLLFRNR